jgi:hypothetical protein
LCKELRLKTETILGKHGVRTYGEIELQSANFSLAKKLSRIVLAGYACLVYPLAIPLTGGTTLIENPFNLTDELKTIKTITYQDQPINVIIEPSIANPKTARYIKISIGEYPQRLALLQNHGDLVRHGAPQARADLTSTQLFREVLTLAYPEEMQQAE